MPVERFRRLGVYVREVSKRRGLDLHVELTGTGVSWLQGILEVALVEMRLPHPADDRALLKLAVTAAAFADGVRRITSGDFQLDAEETAALDDVIKLLEVEG